MNSLYTLYHPAPSIVRKLTRQRGHILGGYSASWFLSWLVCTAFYLLDCFALLFFVALNNYDVFICGFGSNAGYYGEDGDIYPGGWEEGGNGDLYFLHGVGSLVIGVVSGHPLSPRDHIHPVKRAEDDRLIGCGISEVGFSITPYKRIKNNQKHDNSRVVHPTFAGLSEPIVSLNCGGEKKAVVTGRGQRREEVSGSKKDNYRVFLYYVGYQSGDSKTHKGRGACGIVVVALLNVSRYALDK